MNNQNENKSTDIEFLKNEQFLIKKKLDLLMALFDDISKMYLGLEKDLYLSGKIKKRYSDDGSKYDITRDD